MLWPARAAAAEKAPPLRVGITLDYPPLAMEQDGQVAGLEGDLARHLGAALGRPVQFVRLKWREQFDALLGNRTDIIMTGLSMTREREMRVAFVEPYMKNAVMGMVRRADAGQFKTAEDVKQFAGTIGIQKGTTAAVFVQEQCPQARTIEVADPAYAVYELNRRRLDLFLHDGHALAWQVSEHESDMSGVWIPLTEEYIAWAVRRGDTELAAKATAVLQTWKSDGTLKALLERWLPYADQIQVPAGTRPELPRLLK